MRNRKFNLLQGLLVLVIGIIFFFSTYYISGKIIDKRLDLEPLTTEDIIEYDNSTIIGIKPVIDGVTYSSIHELVGVVTKPTVCEVEVTYSTMEQPATFEAYISFNSDASVSEATFTSGDYFQIILPSLNSISSNN